MRREGGPHQLRTGTQGLASMRVPFSGSRVSTLPLEDVLWHQGCFLETGDRPWGSGEHTASLWAQFHLWVPVYILAPGPANVRSGPEEGPVTAGGRVEEGGMEGTGSVGHREGGGRCRPAGNIAVSLSALHLGP